MSHRHLLYALNKHRNSNICDELLLILNWYGDNLSALDDVFQL